MRYQFSAQTDLGLTRKNNEDSVVFDAATQTMILADGMGGYNAGEIASGMATAFIKSELSRWLAEVGHSVGVAELRRAMQICVDNANLSIFNAASSNAQYAGMGTTLVVGVFLGESLVLGHIGDSRCYRVREGALEQITKDHSVLQEQIDAGLTTPAQAETSPIKNLLTRALGVDAQVVLEVNEYAVLPGDLYMMCSDGLSDMVNNPAIAKILLTETALELVAQELITAANAQGGRDNTSVLLAIAQEAAEKRGLIARLLRK